MNVELTSWPRAQQSAHGPQLENHARAVPIRLVEATPITSGWAAGQNARGELSLPAGATTATPGRGAPGPVSTSITAAKGIDGWPSRVGNEKPHEITSAAPLSRTERATEISSVNSIASSTGSSAAPSSITE